MGLTYAVLAVVVTLTIGATAFGSQLSNPVVVIPVSEHWRSWSMAAVGTSRWSAGRGKASTKPRYEGCWRSPQRSVFVAALQKPTDG